MSPFQTTLWIVHREPGPRSALGRLAAAAPGRHEVVLGGPEDSVFDAAREADVVVLDVSTALADPEPELDLARRIQRANPDCAWVLVSPRGALETTLRLFDALDARVISGPPDLRTLRSAVAAALERRSVPPLSHRLGRDLLSARFVRWFSAGEPRELALALDPRLASEPVLARGETGTGRGLLLRYVHTTSSADPGPFLRVACSTVPGPDDLILQIAEGAREFGGRRGRFGIWLDELDALSEPLQLRVLDWIDFGPPPVLPREVRGNLRWFASVSDDPARLSARVALAFAELSIRTVPLRERAQVIPAFVADTARAWASSRGEPAMQFGAAAIDRLCAEPWPGNLAELEAVVTRSLAHAEPSAAALGPEDLRFGPEVEDVVAAEHLPPLPDTLEDPQALLEGPQALPDTPAAPFAPFEPVAVPTEDAGEPWPPSAAGAEEVVVDLAPDDDPGAALPHARIIDLELPDPVEEAEPLSGIAAGDDPEAIAKLAKAVAHEVRNPLVSIRTFSDLLQEEYQDPAFRERFGAMVADDVRRIESVVERLEQMGEAPQPAENGAVDITMMLESLLDEQRAGIQAKRLLVLKELDRARPHARADETLLMAAMRGLLERAIDEAPERGDLYLSSRHHEPAPGRAAMRIVLRYRVEGAPSDSDLALETFRSTNLAGEVAQSIIERQGGSLAIALDDPQETVVTVDLPADPAPR